MMKLLIALMMTCSLAAARVTPHANKIRFVNNCNGSIELSKYGWFRRAGHREFKCDSTEGVDTITLKKGERMDVSPWFSEPKSNYFGFWDREVPVYENHKRCKEYTYNELVGASPSTCEDDEPPETGYIGVKVGHEYRLCHW